MQGMVSGVLLVAAFAAAAGACGLMAVRLYRVSGTAGRGEAAAQREPASRSHRDAAGQGPADA